MTIGGFVFAPRAVPTIAAAALIALTVSLGRWQAHRAVEKDERQALLEARVREPEVRLTGAVPSADPLLFRHVRAAGRWVRAGQIYVDNQVLDGRAGFEVVTPLKLDGSDAAVLVNRGWVARTDEYPRAPDVPVPPGPVEVAGLATLPPARYLELSSDTISGPVWQNLSIARYRAHTGMAVLPIVILADPPGPGLARITQSPDAGSARHREYELTWFSLAITTLALWVTGNLRRAR